MTSHRIVDDDVITRICPARYVTSHRVANDVIVAGTTRGRFRTSRHLSSPAVVNQLSTPPSSNIPYNEPIPVRSNHPLSSTSDAAVRRRASAPAGSHRSDVQALAPSRGFARSIATCSRRASTQGEAPKHPQSSLVVTSSSTSCFTNSSSQAYRAFEDQLRRLYTMSDFLMFDERRSAAVTRRPPSAHYRAVIDEMLSAEEISQSDQHFNSMQSPAWPETNIDRNGPDTPTSLLSQNQLVEEDLISSRDVFDVVSIRRRRSSIRNESRNTQRAANNAIHSRHDSEKPIAWFQLHNSSGDTSSDNDDKSMMENTGTATAAINVADDGLNDRNFNFSSVDRRWRVTLKASEQTQKASEQTQRATLYDRYLERPNRWTDGLTEEARRIVEELMERKKFTAREKRPSLTVCAPISL